MELNKILSDARWGDMAAFINGNFEKIRVELMKLRYASILTFCKGYFSTESRLLSKYPTGKTGEYAFVGTPWPGTVWEWVDSAWVDTGVAPQLGESVFIELLKRHIDNKTILWDDKERYIYSPGGGSVFTITAGMDASSAGRCRVEAAGDVMSVTPSDDGGSYTVTGSAGGTVTVRIVAEEGYQVQKLDVDDVSQGNISEYTFEHLDRDHTMKVWLEEDISSAIPPVYTRSDVPTAYFGIYNAIRSVLQDYPDGLTRDVTITCTQSAVDYKGNSYQGGDSMWNAEMSRWNQDTPYVLTIDGAGKCILDGRGFGGIRIEECSNIVFRNITFQNFNTYEGVYAPEEPACIYAANISKKKACRNLYFENLTILGQSTKTPASVYRTRYGITVKDYENVYMHNIRMSQVVVQPVFISSARTVYISKLKFGRSDMQPEVIGHPAVMNLSAMEVHIVDCDIDGSSYNEAAISIGNVTNLYLRRNHIYNTRGPVLSVNNELGVDKIVVDCNYLHDNVTLPKYHWDCTWLSMPARTSEFIFTNNVAIFSSDYFQEFFMRATSSEILRLVNVNNVYIRKNTQNHGIYLLNRIGELVSGRNLWKGNTNFYSTSDPSSAVSLPWGLKFDAVQKRGHEAGSELMTGNENILACEQESGGRPCLLPALAETYKSMAEYVSEFDYKYEANAPDNCSIGCDNCFSTAFDEASDTTAGYSGTNQVSGDTFSSAAQYGMPSGQTLVLLDNSRNRDKFTRFTVSRHDDPSDRLVALGRLVAFSILPELDENGEYVADRLYDVTIE